MSLVSQRFLSALALRVHIAGRLRGLWIKLRLKAIGAQVGKRLSADRGVQVVTVLGASWALGDRVSLGAGVILTVGKGASLTIGDDVRITHYTIIGAEASISIAARTQVGEHCSIRDHDHDVSPGSIHGAAVVCSPVSIGADSWVGRGVAILRGSRVGAGAIIGANAVVRGEIPDDSIAAGVPARIIRSRLSAPSGR